MNSSEPLRELTPGLVRGPDGAAEQIGQHRLASGHEATLIHHVFGNGRVRRLQTAALLRVPETQAYAPALVCRDHGELAADPAELPAERWQPIELESSVFNRRYRTLFLAGQDPGWLRELFSPRLIDWLADEAPAGLSFELNDGWLAVFVPGHLREGGDLEPLLAAAQRIAASLGAEALEEEFDPDLFRESSELADLERVLPKVSWSNPPASAREALWAYQRVAMRSPGARLGALLVALLAAAAIGALAWIAFDPLEALIVAVPVALVVYQLVRFVIGYRYRWGTISVARAGVEAFVREYARSRGLELEDRWRFHSRHPTLPLPGFADHVLRGRLPGSGAEGRFLMLADAGELRARGVDMGHAGERSAWASNAVLVDEAELASLVADAITGDDEKATDYRVERDGDRVLVWKPIPGNLIRTAAGSDLFCARAVAVAKRAVAADAGASPRPPAADLGPSGSG